MIDIHCHILPNVDDGARDITVSLAIAKAAAKAGVKTMVATPHLMDGHLSDSYQRKIDQAFSTLNQALAKNQVDIQLLLGMEIYLTPEIGSLVKEFPNLGLNASPLVLLELPMQEAPTYTEHVIYELLVQGKQPIIAHPERCRAIQKDLSIYSSMLAKGAQGQINAGSLLGGYGRGAKKAAKKILSQGMAHFMASDIHSLPWRGYPLPRGLKKAAKIIGQEKALQLVSAPPALISH